MEWQWLAQAVLGILIAAMGAFMKHMYRKTEDNTKSISDAKQHAAETYVTKTDHFRQQERMEGKLDKILEKLDKKMDKS